MRRAHVSIVAVLLVIVTQRASVQTPTYQTSPRPMPALDTMKIAGEVTIANTPAVTVANTPSVSAHQAGTWIVGLAGPQVVSAGVPAFLRVKQSYLVTWPSGRTETVQVVSVGDNGWVQVQNAKGERWLNPAMVASFEER